MLSASTRSFSALPMPSMLAAGAWAEDSRHIASGQEESRYSTLVIKCLTHELKKMTRRPQ
jgi:hypothetical protein